MSVSSLEQKILDSLLQRWGYIMGSAGLRKAMGFSSQAALRNALQRFAAPFPVFTIEGRRGPFALTHEVASWLASRGEDHSSSELAAPQASVRARVTSRATTLRTEAKRSAQRNKEKTID